MPTLRRRIDPQRRDYVLTLGEYEEDIGVTSKVFARVATKKGSVVPLPSFGSELHTIKGPIPGFEQLARRFVENAVSDMIRAREISSLLVDVSVDRSGPDAVLCLDINFRDRRGRAQQVKYSNRLIGS